MRRIPTLTVADENAFAPDVSGPPEGLFPPAPFFFVQSNSAAADVGAPSDKVLALESLSAWPSELATDDRQNVAYKDVAFAAPTNRDLHEASENVTVAEAEGKSVDYFLFHGGQDADALTDWNATPVLTSPSEPVASTGSASSFSVFSPHADSGLSAVALVTAGAEIRRASNSSSHVGCGFARRCGRARRDWLIHLRNARARTRKYAKPGNQSPLRLRLPNLPWARAAPMRRRCKRPWTKAD